VLYNTKSKKRPLDNLSILKGKRADKQRGGKGEETSLPFLNKGGGGESPHEGKMLHYSDRGGGGKRDISEAGTKGERKIREKRVLGLGSGGKLWGMGRKKANIWTLIALRQKRKRGIEKLIANANVTQKQSDQNVRVNSSSQETVKAGRE